MRFDAYELPLGRMLRGLRERRGLSQEDLAAILRGLAGREGLQRGEVSRWERGVRVPKPRWLAWLAVALDAPLAELDAARRAQLGLQGGDARSPRWAGGFSAGLLGVAAQVGTRFRDQSGHAVPDVDEVDGLREAVRQAWRQRDGEPDGDACLWPDGQVRGRRAAVGEPDGAKLCPAGVSGLAEPTAGRRLADALGWDQVPQLSADERQRADEELAGAQARARRFYGIDVPDASPVAHAQRPGSTGADAAVALPSSRTQDHSRMRACAPVRVSGRDFAALVAVLVANRDDVRWLKQAVQALVDHHGIGDHADEARDPGTDAALDQTEEVPDPGRQNMSSGADE